MVGRFEQGCGASARKNGLSPDYPDPAVPRPGPGLMRVVLLSGDYGTARQIDDLLHATWNDAHLVTHATWDAAAAEALLDHPGCCVLLDADPTPETDDPMTLLEYVRMSAPDAPIVLLSADEDEDLTLKAVRQGAQDCLIKSELEPVLLRRALIRAIERKRE